MADDVGEADSYTGRFKRLDNVMLIYVFTFTAYFSRAIWEGSIISSFVYLITEGSAVSIGSLSGTLGFTQIFVAPVMGFLSDIVPRTWILSLASAIGLCAVLLTSYAVQSGDYSRLLHCMIIWGFFWGCTTPCVDSLLADSIAVGKRSEAYTMRSSLLNVSTSFGPLLSSFLFYFIGDKWKLKEIQLVMTIGLLLFIFPCVILFSFHFTNNNSDSSKGSVDKFNCELLYSKIQNFFKDKVKGRSNSLLGRFSSFGEFFHAPTTPKKCDSKYKQVSQQEDLESDAVEEDFKDIELVERSPSEGSTHVDKTISHRIEEGEGGRLDRSSNCDTGDESITKNSDNNCDNNNNQTSSNTSTEVSSSKPSYLFIASMIASGDVISGLASGMTIKFFPIFFMTILRLSPLKLSLLYFITPLMTTVASQWTQKLGLKWGRIFATLFMKSCGISLLLLLAGLVVHREAAALKNDSANNILVIDNLILFVFIIRTASMNSSKGLTKSIIMDIVPKNQRGRWNALESINNATFSGSAILGGYLVQKYGFIHNFLFTAGLQFLAMFPLVIIRNHVSSEA